jgi:two-component system, OmpR family, sensor kinase
MRGGLGLRGRLLVSVLLAIGLALAALTTGFNLVLGNRLDSDADGVVQARASAELAVLRPDHGPMSLGETPDQAAPETPVWVFRGTRVLEAPRASDADNAAAAMLAPSARGGYDVPTTDTRLYAIPVISGGRRLGTVVAGVSLAPYEQTRRTALIASVILAVLAFLAVALGVAWVISRALRPVGRMTKQAAEWSERDLDRRFALGPPRDELTQLAATLDQLLDRLAASLRHEQRLSAELSHELRTPLANIAAEAQYALKHTAQDADGRRALEQVRDSADQMNRTLDTLIAAARAELDPQHATSDAIAGVRAVTAASKPLAAERGITTAFETPDSAVRVASEQALVERMLAPVLENAYRHASATVRITVCATTRVVRFAIEDDGPGVPPGELDTIFEPGRRGETTASGLNGAGLGLALARRLAQSAGGNVEAEHREGGARFVVTLPPG